MINLDQGSQSSLHNGNDGDEDNYGGDEYDDDGGQDDDKDHSFQPELRQPVHRWCP